MHAHPRVLISWANLKQESCKAEHSILINLKNGKILAGYLDCVNCLCEEIMTMFDNNRVNFWPFFSLLKKYKKEPLVWKF